MRKPLGLGHFAPMWTKSEWLFRSLTENLDQCVYVLDQQGCCLAVNDAFCRWLKQSREEIVGRPIADFWPHPAAAREADEHQRVLRGEWIETEEEWPRARETFLVRIRKTPLRDAEGNVRGVLCLFREASVEPAGETSRRQAACMELLGRLTGGIVHDLRNLMTLLGVPLALLRSILPAGVGESELVTMENAVKQGAALTERLLRMARGDAGGLQPIDVNKSCAEVVDLLRYNLGPQIRLDLRLRPGLPPVLAEPGEMMQVLLNLCLNASDAMPQGGQLLLETDLSSVRRGDPGGSSAPRPDEFICLQVRDSGEGMSPEVRARIFEAMFTTKTVGHNSGLGLAVVRDIVQQRGGWIECESALGAGTCFTVWLPAASDHADPIVESSPQHRKQKSILLVASDAAIRLLAATILTQQSFRVLSSSSGRHALELYRQAQGEIDLVAIEEKLPGQSALEVTTELLALNPRLPIVLLNAAGTPAASLSASLSSQALLNKPYTPEQLVQCVRAALSRG